MNILVVDRIRDVSLPKGDPIKKAFFHFLMVGLASVLMLSLHNVKAASLFGGDYLDPDVEYETRSKYRRAVWVNNQGQVFGLSIASAGRRKKLNAEDFLTALSSYPYLGIIRYLKIKDSGMQPEHWERFIQILASCHSLERLYISNRIRPAELRNAKSVYLSIDGVQKGIVLPDERDITIDLRTLSTSHQAEIIKTPDPNRIRRVGLFACLSR